MSKNIIYTLKFKEGFFDDLTKHKKSGQKKLLEKIDTFLDELEIHPSTGTGQVEPLRNFGERSMFSCRIDKKHRLIYEIFEEEKIVKIISAWGHYHEK